MIEPERVRTGVIGVVAAASLIVCAVLVAIAWWLVAPPRDHRPARQPSPLEHGLFDRAHSEDTPRVPIERAIDAVVRDPSLIGLEP